MFVKKLKYLKSERYNYTHPSQDDSISQQLFHYLHIQSGSDTYNKT
jgi:hypothetical protein